MEGFTDTGGLFAVAGHREAVHLTYLGLHAQQHRGTDGVGLAASDGSLLRLRHAEGFVAQALDGASLQLLPGQVAMGVVYGSDTAALPAPTLEIPGSSRGDQLVFGRLSTGQVACAISGHFTNGARLRRELTANGALFQTPSDAELLLHLLAQSTQRTFVNRLVDALWKVQGAYSLIVMTEEHLVAVRDPSGFRPLSLGRLGDAMVVATEDSAIRFVGGEVRRDIRAGEMVVFDGRMQQGVRPFSPAELHPCVHEYVSLARPDAQVFGRAVHPIQVALGERLANEAPCVQADVIIPVPGAEAHGHGFAKAMERPLLDGILRDPFTVLHLEEPPAGLPHFGTRAHFRPIPAAVQGQIVCLVAPSLTTGHVLRKAIALLQEAGAKEVHLRIASPQIRAACPYGVASPAAEQLATEHEGDPAAWLGAATVAWLSLIALQQVAAGTTPGDGRCDACFSGKVPLVYEETDDQLPLFDA
ncbi:MAG: hypothetical protein AAGA48_27370 [Myxococcota bacterium]